MPDCLLFHSNLSDILGDMCLHKDNSLSCLDSQCFNLNPNNPHHHFTSPNISWMFSSSVCVCECACLCVCFPVYNLCDDTDGKNAQSCINYNFTVSLHQCDQITHLLFLSTLIFLKISNELENQAIPTSTLLRCKTFTRLSFLFKLLSSSKLLVLQKKQKT